jgi:hypothetical protein
MWEDMRNGWRVRGGKRRKGRGEDFDGRDGTTRGGMGEGCGEWKRNQRRYIVCRRSRNGGKVGRSKRIVVGVEWLIRVA